MLAVLDFFPSLAQLVQPTVRHSRGATISQSVPLREHTGADAIPQDSPPAAAAPNAANVSPGSTTRPPAPRPPARRNWLAIPRLGLDLSLGTYSDCSGLSPVPHVTAYHYLCTPGQVAVVVGHSPGPFSSLRNASPGDLLIYWDSAGRQWQSQVGQVRYLNVSEASKYDQDGSFPHVVLVTCAKPDGSQDLVVVGNRMSLTEGPT